MRDRRDVDPLPVRVQRRHHRRGRHVQHGAGEERQDHHRQHDEHAERAGAGPGQHDQPARSRRPRRSPRLNSYMLPSGSRPTASPRATIESTFADDADDGHHDRRAAEPDAPGRRRSRQRADPVRSSADRRSVSGRGAAARAAAPAAPPRRPASAAAAGRQLDRRSRPARRRSRPAPPRRRDRTSGPASRSSARHPFCAASDVSRVARIRSAGGLRQRRPARRTPRRSRPGRSGPAHRPRTTVRSGAGRAPDGGRRPGAQPEPDPAPLDQPARASGRPAAAPRRPAPSSCAGSYDVCSDTHSLNPVKVIVRAVVEGDRLADHQVRPRLLDQRARCRPGAVSMANTDCDRPPSMPRSPR